MNLFKRRQPNLPERRRIERRAAPDLEGATTFRRGRTLTGSASSLVQTPSETKADLKSPRVQTHALLKKRRRLTGIFVAVLAVTGALYVLTSQFTAQSVVQASPDPSLRLEPIYTEAIEDYLSNHISERWRMFTDTDQLAAHLRTKVPEVKDIRVRGSAGFGKSLFELTFREPIASWDVSNRQLYVDAAGIPFTRNYFNPPALHIVDQSGMMATAAGQSIMSNRFMSYIGQVIGLSKQQGYVVKSIVIPEGMTRQIEVHLEGVEYPFKFSSDRPAGEGVNDMVKSQQWMKARQLTPEYVDVRVKGRVFYRD